MQYTQKDKNKYAYQKHRAKERNIEFKLTFEEWWQFWMNSGVYHLRGKKANQYVMGRIGDKGAYEVGNIYPTTVRENQRYARAVNPQNKLSKQQEAEVLKLLPTTKRQDLADMFGVSRRTIQYLVKREGAGRSR
jgi:hypothetical protein